MFLLLLYMLNVVAEQYSNPIVEMDVCIKYHGEAAMCSNLVANGGCLQA